MNSVAFLVNKDVVSLDIISLYAPWVIILNNNYYKIIYINLLVIIILLIHSQIIAHINIRY